MENEAGFWIPDDALGVQGTRNAPDQASADEWRARLHDVDPNLMLVFAHAGATDLTPNRWHLIRRNQYGRNSYWEINDGAGGYSPYTERHFERLQATDAASHPRLWAIWKKKQADKSRAAKAKLDARGEEFQEKLLERLDSAFDAHVAIPAELKEKVDG